jgi:hypothetical protein
MESEHVYVTRTPDNLLTYQTAVVCERLKTRYRVRTDDNLTLTFNNKSAENHGVFIFAMTDSLNAKIEAYQNLESNLLELILNSEKIQSSIAEKITNYLSVDGNANIDLNCPDVSGRDFYLVSNN